MIPVETASAWNELVGRAERLGLQQDWAYGAALAARGQSVHRFALGPGAAPIGLVQIAERRLALSRFAVALRGPVWFGGDLAARVDALGQLRAAWRWRQRQFLLMQPEQDSDVLVAAGARQVITGSHALWLDLRPDEDALRRRMHGKWRNRLVQAEAAGMSVQQAQGGAPLAELLAREAGQRDTRGYRSADAAFTNDLIARIGKPATLVLSARQGRETVAAMLFLRTGASANYLIGWSGEAGRTLAAHHFLLWRAMLVLRAAGVRHIELGGGYTEGLLRFKQGSGAELVQFPGGYL